MDFLVICCIISITHIQPLTALANHGSYLSEEKVSKTSDDDKKVNINLEPVVIENKQMYYLLKAEVLNENLLDRLVEKLTLIQPKPLVKIDQANAAENVNNQDIPSRRLVSLDEAKFAMKSLPKYEHFIEGELAKDYKEMAHQLFGVNRKNMTTTEKYLKTESENNRSIDIELGLKTNEEISTSTFNPKNEIETAKLHRRFEIVKEIDRLRPYKDNVNNTQETNLDEVINDPNSDIEAVLYNSQEPKDQHCMSDITSFRRSGDILEKEITVTHSDGVKNQTNVTNAETSPPVIRLLKKAWSKFMEDDAKIANLKAMSVRNRSQSNAKKDDVKNENKMEMSAENSTESNVNDDAKIANKKAISAEYSAQSNFKDGAEIVNKKEMSAENSPESNVKEENQLENQTVSSKEPVVVVPAAKDLVMKPNRRMLSDDDYIVNEDKTNNPLMESNLWCSTGLLCRKTRVPVCGLDLHMGYAKFEDICHLLLNNCYYNHQFIPTESCGIPSSSEES